VGQGDAERKMPAGLTASLATAMEIQPEVTALDRDLPQFNTYIEMKL